MFRVGGMLLMSVDYSEIIKENKRAQARVTLGQQQQTNQNWGTSQWFFLLSH